jgi:hypothetical protein
MRSVSQREAVLDLVWRAAMTLDSLPDNDYGA